MKRNNPYTLPFRATRFAFHLIRIGQSKALAQEILSECASIISGPWFHSMRIEGKQGYSLHTDFNVALDSPDYATPWGAIHNWKTNRAFIREMFMRYGPHGSILDLGCSTGRLVQDFNSIGWGAVGLEGSPSPKIEKIGAWANNYLDSNLFCCDIGKPFQLLKDKRPTVFDVVTAWEVLEHLDEQGLVTLCKNIRAHTKEGSIFFISTDNSSEKPEGIELHLTRWTKQEWLAFIKSNLPEFRIVPALAWWKCVRRSARGLNFALLRTK